MAHGSREPSAASVTLFVERCSKVRQTDFAGLATFCRRSTLRSFLNLGCTPVRSFPNSTETGLSSRGSALLANESCWFLIKVDRGLHNAVLKWRRKGKVVQSLWLSEGCGILFRENDKMRFTLAGERSEEEPVAEPAAVPQAGDGNRRDSAHPRRAPPPSGGGPHQEGATSTGAQAASRGTPTAHRQGQRLAFARGECAVLAAPFRRAVIICFDMKSPEALSWVQSFYLWVKDASAYSEIMTGGSEHLTVAKLLSVSLCFELTAMF